MADIICRWRNGTPQTVVELVNSLPHKMMPNDKFRSFMHNSIWGPDFFRTPYQLACQLGLYYESDDGYYHPRFDHDINEQEAQEYLELWLPRYYVPNPYVGKNGFNNIECPTYMLIELYKYAKTHPNCLYADAYRTIFNEEANNNNDIVKNYINNFSKVLRFEKDGQLTITDNNPNIIFDFMDRNDKKGFFDNFATKAHAHKLIIEQKVLASFILSIVKYFYAIDELNAIVPYTSSSSPIKVSKDGAFSLVGMFLESTIDDVKERNKEHARWFEDVFTLGERSVYLSTQWNSQGDYQLTLDDFIKMIKTCYGDNYIYKIGPNKEHQLWSTDIVTKAYFSNKDKYLPYLSALRTKPFMLLAGISGTGKSRIVRELAKACWKEGDEEFGKNHPKNFCMVQVKPNWHDSSELIGYVSRINGEKYVVGPFLRFLAKAIKDEYTPYFLCLDEMNLAPVEQYFAEYLSVIESRKLNADGSITTDPIIPYENTEAYGTLIDQLFDNEEDRKAYKSENGGKRLTIPQNLFVVGTVNMDETTFSFSRKVLDRAMTIEMNEVNLYGGLTDEGSEIGYIGNCIIGTAAEGKDVYSDNKELCDQVLAYLEKVNTVLEGTPFKIAYRTRNEFLLYAVSRQLLDKDSQLWQTLDEMTSMKILARIEGDSERTKTVLEGLKALVEKEITQTIPVSEEGEERLKSITAAKIEEMLGKLKVSGYTSYWA